MGDVDCPGWVVSKSCQSKNSYCYFCICFVFNPNTLYQYFKILGYQFYFSPLEFEIMGFDNIGTCTSKSLTFHGCWIVLKPSFTCIPFLHIEHVCNNCVLCTGKNAATHVYFLRTRNFITEYDFLIHMSIYNDYNHLWQSLAKGFRSSPLFIMACGVDRKPLAIKDEWYLVKFINSFSTECLILAAYCW